MLNKVLAALDHILARAPGFHDQVKVIRDHVMSSPEAAMDNPKPAEAPVIVPPAA